MSAADQATEGVFASFFLLAYVLRLVKCELRLSEALQPGCLIDVYTIAPGLAPGGGEQLD